jgi:hypothetical protein
MIYQADFIGLLRTIAIIALVYFGIKLIARYVLPFLLRWGAKKAQEKMYDDMNQRQQNRHNQQSDKQQVKDDGKVKIEYIKKKKRQSYSDNDGEYVDFEEIKDD